mgnify:FL=1
MRNWNRYFQNLTHFKIAGFYLTYEELKPGNDGELKVEGFEILSYLWGIETNGRSSVSSTGIKILSYLWGIETL